MKLTTRDFFILWAIITALAILECRGQGGLRNGAWVAAATRPAATSPSLPADITDVQVWIKPESISGTAGTAVSQWNDSSGNNRHFYQGSTGNNPAVSGLTLNGYKAVYFDGVNDVLTNAFGTTLSQPNSVWMVVSITNQDNSKFKIICDGVYSSERNYLAITDSGSSTNWGLFSGTEDQAHGLFFSSNQFHSVAAVFNTTSSRIYTNGVVTGVNNGSPGNSGLSGMTLGGRYALATLFSRMNLVELVLVNYALSESQRASLGLYATNKFGL